MKRLTFSRGIHCVALVSMASTAGSLAVEIVGAVPDRPSAGTPLTLRKNAVTPQHLDLTWGDSCGPDQNDFAVYEGTIGAWYSHTAKLCSTAGGLSASDLIPSSGSSYYLIVPLSAINEGSYGTNTANAQLPMGSSPCRATQSTAACVWKRAFVSSSSFTADFGGASGADNACQSLANIAGLGGAWRAWISDSLSSPSTRFTQATVSYRRIDGTLIAADWAGLTSGTLLNSVATDEYGALLANSEVWTATSTSGTYAGAGCQNFTSTSTFAPFPYVGISNRSTSDWTTVFLEFCDRTGIHLYCFEQ